MLRFAKMCQCVLLSGWCILRAMQVPRSFLHRILRMLIRQVYS